MFWFLINLPSYRLAHTGKHINILCTVSPPDCVCRCKTGNLRVNPCEALRQTNTCHLHLKFLSSLIFKCFFSSFHSILYSNSPYQGPTVLGQYVGMHPLTTISSIDTSVQIRNSALSVAANYRYFVSRQLVRLTKRRNSNTISCV